MSSHYDGVPITKLGSVSPQKTPAFQEAANGQGVPNELLEEIFSHLDAKTYAMVERASHHFRNVAVANEPRYVKEVEQRESQRLQHEAICQTASLNYDNVDFLDALVRYDRTVNLHSIFDDGPVTKLRLRALTNLRLQAFASLYADSTGLVGNGECANSVSRSRSVTDLDGWKATVAAARCLYHIQAIITAEKEAGQWPDDGLVGDACYDMISRRWMLFAQSSIRPEDMIIDARPEVSLAEAKAMVRRVQTTLPFGKYTPEHQACVDQSIEDECLQYSRRDRQHTRLKVEHVLRNTLNLPMISERLQYFVQDIRIYRSVRDKRFASALHEAALLQETFVGVRHECFPMAKK